MNNGQFNYHQASQLTCLPSLLIANYSLLTDFALGIKAVSSQRSGEIKPKARRLRNAQINEQLIMYNNNGVTTGNCWMGRRRKFEKNLRTNPFHFTLSLRFNC